MSTNPFSPPAFLFDRTNRNPALEEVDHLPSLIEGIAIKAEKTLVFRADQNAYNILFGDEELVEDWNDARAIIRAVRIYENVRLELLRYKLMVHTKDNIRSTVAALDLHLLDQRCRVTQNGAAITVNSAFDQLHSELQHLARAYDFYRELEERETLSIDEAITLMEIQATINPALLDDATWPLFELYWQEHGSLVD